ncbi:MAG: carboxymuconolactone decarboxylase family protein [Bacteroidota bacterium]
MTDLGWLIRNAKQFSRAKKAKRVSRSFMEKIMLVTTAVNGCVYCAWYHAKLSVKSGINRDEVKSLLNLQFNADSDDFETLGLLYAQHYAETDRKPDEEMTDKLFKFYGEKTTKDIILYIRAIYFGNLAGNTFDAFLSRRKGIKAKKSNALFEFVFFLFSAPILWPTLPYVKKYR